MPHSIARLLPKLRQNVVRIRTSKTLGSGVILGRIAETTIVATCYHLLDDDPKAPFDVVLVGRDGQELVGEGTEIHWYDHASDFVILVTDLPKRRGAPKGAGFGRPTPARVGEDVYAIGNPADLEQVVSRGIVSCHSDDGVSPILVHDAHVNPGSSGGPLFDARGRLLGIVTTKFSDDSEGLNIALPIDYVMFRAKPLFELVWNEQMQRTLPLRFESTSRFATEERDDTAVLAILRGQVQSACGLDLHRAYYLASFQRTLARRRATEQIHAVFQHRGQTDHVVVHVSGTQYKLIEQRDGKWMPCAAASASAPRSPPHGMTSNRRKRRGSKR